VGVWRLWDSTPKEPRETPPLPRPLSDDLRSGAEWPVPPEAIKRIRMPETDYFIDVEIVWDSEGNPVPTGVAIRLGVPMKRAARVVDSPYDYFAETTEPLPISPREVRRLPISTCVQWAIAHATDPIGEEGERVQKDALKPKGARAHTSTFYRDLARRFLALQQDPQIDRPVRVLAKERGVKENVVHQWLYRARESGDLPRLPRGRKTTRRRRQSRGIK
jgi:hypothetical protein